MTQAPLLSWRPELAFSGVGDKLFRKVDLVGQSCPAHLTLSYMDVAHVFTVYLVIWQCCSTLSRDWVSFCTSWSCHGFKSIWTDCVLDSRQSLVTSTMFCGLWQFVCLWTEASSVCAAKICMTLTWNMALFTPNGKFFYTVWFVQTLFRSLSWLKLNLCSSARTLTRVSWSRLLHCHFVFHSLLTFTYECAGDQEHMHMHGFVF